MGQWPESMSTSSRCLGLRKLGRVIGVDPLLGLGWGELGADEYYGDVVPSLVQQTHGALAHLLGDGEGRRRHAALGLLVEVDRVRPLERGPTGKGIRSLLASKRSA